MGSLISFYDRGLRRFIQPFWEGFSQLAIEGYQLKHWEKCNLFESHFEKHRSKSVLAQFGVGGIASDGSTTSTCACCAYS
jgi:hypothetical protein